MFNSLAKASHLAMPNFNREDRHILFTKTDIQIFGNSNMVFYIRQILLIFFFTVNTVRTLNTYTNIYKFLLNFNRTLCQGFSSLKKKVTIIPTHSITSLFFLKLLPSKVNFSRNYCYTTLTFSLWTLKVWFSGIMSHILGYLNQNPYCVSGFSKR